MGVWDVEQQGHLLEQLNWMAEPRPEIVSRDARANATFGRIRTFQGTAAADNISLGDDLKGEADKNHSPRCCAPANAAMTSKLKFVRYGRR